MDLAPGALPLHAEPTRLRQVVGNLLNNAAQYAPRAGRIALRARREHDHALITVTDDGIGIGADALDQVFDMFTQVGRERRARPRQRVHDAPADDDSASGHACRARARRTTAWRQAHHRGRRCD